MSAPRRSEPAAQREARLRDTWHDDPRSGGLAAPQLRDIHDALPDAASLLPIARSGPGTYGMTLLDAEGLAAHQLRTYGISRCSSTRTACCSSQGLDSVRTPRHMAYVRSAERSVQRRAPPTPTSHIS